MKAAANWGTKKAVAANWDMTGMVARVVEGNQVAETAADWSVVEVAASYEAKTVGDWDVAGTLAKMVVV